MSRLKNWLSKEDKTLKKSDVKSRQPVTSNDAKSGLKSAGVIESETNFYRYMASKALLLQQVEEVDSEISENRI